MNQDPDTEAAQRDSAIINSAMSLLSYVKVHSTKKVKTVSVILFNLLAQCLHFNLE